MFYVKGGNFKNIANLSNLLCLAGMERHISLALWFRLKEFDHNCVFLKKPKYRFLQKLFE